MFTDFATAESRQKTFRKFAPLLAAATIALAGQAAHATDGYFLNGVGAKADGEAGVAIALPQDALSIAANPASATELGHRVDGGLQVFVPDRSATIHGNNLGGGYTLNGTYSGNGANPFVLPEIGFVRPLSDKVSIGIAIYGNGGMNTVYKTNPFGAIGASGPAGVDLKQIFITPTIAAKVLPGQSLGISPLVVVQSFRATGIQPFAGYSAHPASGFNDPGESWSTGAGVRVGYLGHFGSALTIGAFYQTKVWTGKFGKYAGLFADAGGFDVPASWGGGVALKATDRLTLGADVKRIEYSGVASVGDSLAPLFSGVPFGAAGGPGFGWQDITVFKLGASYVVNPSLTVRAGYGHSGNPVPASQTLLNILAPGVVQNHFTLGATYTTSGGVELTGYVLHAPRNTVYGSNSIPGAPTPFGGGEADVSLGENAVGLNAGVKF
jgi:long-chain fatty acid transport protein